MVSLHRPPKLPFFKMVSLLNVLSLLGTYFHTQGTLPLSIHCNDYIRHKFVFSETLTKLQLELHTTVPNVTKQFFPGHLDNSSSDNLPLTILIWAIPSPNSSPSDNSPLIIPSWKGSGLSLKRVRIVTGIYCPSRRTSEMSRWDCPEGSCTGGTCLMGIAQGEAIVQEGGQLSREGLTWEMFLTSGQDLQARSMQS